ncbi:MAG TPA: efflux RND transporter periplasmic adaptor subunit [Vicinamibacterales bacterium]|nr:efflux RND transporter periplasmic adaptor subunit [Vicinamibacterales bacterium]
MPAQTRRTRTRLVAWTIGGLIVAALVVAMLMPSPVAVDLATVTRGDLQVTLDHQGKTYVRHRYTVSAPVAGRVLRIDLEPGTPVEAGKTIVATFRPATSPLIDARSRRENQARVQAAQASVDQAKAELARIRAQRAYADQQLKRTQDMFEEGLVTADALDAALSNARALAEGQDAAEYALRTAQHDLEAARAALLPSQTGDEAGGDLAIRAPVTGVVLQRLHESEAVVPAGEPLMEIADPADLEIISDYLSTDAVQMRPGMPVEIDRWGGPQPLRGRVRLIEPYGFLKVSALGVEEQRVNVHIEFEDPRTAWRKLGDGYRVETRVIIWQRTNVLKVPTSALFRQGDRWAVYLSDGGRARLRTIEIGQRSGLEAEVLKGLQQGDRVVLHPPDTLTDGTRIEGRQE